MQITQTPALKNQFQLNLFCFKAQLVEIKIERDILEMKLQAELKNTHRLNRETEHFNWAKNELMDMIHRSRCIDELRKKVLSRRLY